MDKLTTVQLIAVFSSVFSATLSISLLVNVKLGYLSKNSLEARLTQFIVMICFTVTAVCVVFGYVFSVPKQN